MDILHRLLATAGITNHPGNNLRIEVLVLLPGMAVTGLRQSAEPGYESCSCMWGSAVTAN